MRHVCWMDGMLYFDKTAFKKLMTRCLHVALLWAAISGFAVFPGAASPGGDGDLPEPIEMVTLTGMDVWPEPGYHKSSMGRLESGAKIKGVVHPGGKWIKIPYNGKTGYIIFRSGYFRVIHKNMKTGGGKPSGQKNRLVPPTTNMAPG